MTEAPHMLVAEDGPILVCTLNRPEKLNALSTQLLEIYEQALLRFRDTPGLRVLLIRANGRYFSAGADLYESRAKDPDQSLIRTATAIREHHRLRLNGMRRIYDEMEQIEKPIVVAHHAPCVGGGLELSLSCDFRLAAKSARYHFPEGKQGVLPASNGVSRLTRLCGPHWARYMIMAEREVSAERALIMGLVHEVFPDETFEAEVMAFCRDLLNRNGEVMGAAKNAIERLAADLDAAQAGRLERLANSALMLNPGFTDIIEAHLKSVGSHRSRG